MGDHRWRFFRAGGVDQVMFRDGRDLAHLGELNQKLWVALAMPVKGVALDPRTLELLDEDKDGRIRAPEILAAVRWVVDTRTDLDLLYKGGDSVDLAQIVAGPAREAARAALVTVGREAQSAVTLADVTEAQGKFASLPLNGDGVVPPESAGSDDARKLVEDVIATTGGVNDRNGKPGVDAAKLDAFLADAQLCRAWNDAAALPLGDQTEAAAAALTTLRVKIDDWFTRCKLLAFDARAAAASAAPDPALTDLLARELAPGTPELGRLPLAKVSPAQTPVLNLADAPNPAWADAVTAFQERLLPAGVTRMTETDWTKLKAKLAPYLTWQAAKPGSPVMALGAARIAAILDGAAVAALRVTIAEDLAREKEHEKLTVAEKIVRFQRDLVKVLNNFVSFAEFYGKRDGAFQAGTLYLDGRSCDLCFAVGDMGRHSVMSVLAGTFLAYCECTRPGGEKMTIAAAFTGGDASYIISGRNGVFYDRLGRDWDATITKLVSNPISIREAFFAPYVKFVRMVEEQFAKRAAAADADTTSAMAKTAETAANVDKLPVPPPPKKIDVGTVAALGVAIGGIGAMVAGLLSAFFGLGAWMPIGLLALLLMISGPSMILAYLKLRQRNLGPILDAGGWAINGRTRINVPFGGALTDVATLPEGSERTLRDPYAEKRRPWKLYATVAVILGLALAWYMGKVDRFLPGPVKSIRVLGSYAPAHDTPSEKAEKDKK